MKEQNEEDEDTTEAEYDDDIDKNEDENEDDDDNDIEKVGNIADNDKIFCIWTVGWQQLLCFQIKKALVYKYIK